MLFLCYPKCSTCRKAQKWLDEHDVDYDIRDIKTDNPDLAELELWHQASGLPLKKFFNTSGQLYRSLELSKKLPGMSDAEQYALLASDGMLVKRPILITDDNKVLVGFKEDQWAEALRLCDLYHCKAALLKERSPSCGSGQIYDGTFTHTLTEGDGLTAQMLKKKGVEVYGESQLEELINDRPFFFSI